MEHIPPSTRRLRVLSCLTNYLKIDNLASQNITLLATKLEYKKFEAEEESFTNT